MDTQPSWNTLFSLAGIPFTFNHTSWKFVPPKIVIGIFVAVITLPEEPLAGRLLWGILYGILLLVVLFSHIIGHIGFSKWVLPPMTEARITPILIQTLYSNDDDTISGRVHLIRSLGGPIVTLTLGICMLLLWSVYGGHPILFFALANLSIFAIVLLPFPTVDGQVIWREVVRMLRSQRTL